MRRSRPIVAAVSLGIAAAIVAAPATAAPAKAPVKYSKATLAKNNKVIKDIRVQNRAYSSLRTKVAACATTNAPTGAAVKSRAKAELTRAANLRLKALKGVKAKSSPASLRTKKVQMTTAVKGLSAVSRLCRTAAVPTAVPAASSAVAPAPQPVVVTVNAPGTPAGTSTVPVTVGDLLGVGKVLPDGLLPQTLSIADGLVPSLLTATNGVLALDPNALTAALDGAITGALPACRILDVGCLLDGVIATVNGLLTTVNAALTTGNVNDLLTVGNLSGNVLQLVPTGALADLLNSLPTEALEGVLGTQIGALHILG